MIADRQRRLDFCPGCGYYWRANGYTTHRADCTANEARRGTLVVPSVNHRR